MHTAGTSLRLALEDAVRVLAFFGGQQIGPVYVESTKGIDSSFQYSPFQDYVYSQMQTVLGKALSDKSDLASAFDELQTTVSDYATSQGFEVSK